MEYSEMPGKYHEFEEAVWDAGYAAYGANDLISDNPYAANTGERDKFIDWLAGWCQAAQEDVGP